MALVTSFALGVMVGSVVTWSFRRGAKPNDLNGVPTPAGKSQRDPDTPWPPPPDTRHQAAAIIVMDRLEHIDGIVPDLARDLNQAGILTYADLAAQSPERLRALVHAALPSHSHPTREINVESWPAQAQALADRLTHGEPKPAL